MPETLTSEQKKAQTHDKPNAFAVIPEKAEAVRKSAKLPDQEPDIKTLWKGFSREKREKIIKDLSPDELMALGDQLGLSGHATDVKAAPGKWTPEGLKNKAYNLFVKGTDFLPTAGGIAGGIAGAAVAGSTASPAAAFAGRTVGSGAGGGAGEIARQAILHGLGVDKNDPKSPEERVSDVAHEALYQAGAEVSGYMLGKMLRPTLDKSINKIVAAGELGATDVEHLENTINDLTRYEKMPGNKVLTIGDTADLIKTAKNDIGNQVDLAMAQRINVNGQWVPLGSATANVQPITTELQNVITNNPDLARGALGADPAFQKAVMARLRNYLRPRNFTELTNHRITLNNNLRAMYDLPKGEQRAYMLAHPNLVIDKAEADAIRDVIYPQMDKVAGLPNGTTARLQTKRGALMSLADTFDKQVKELHAKTREIAGKGIFERGNISTYGTSSGRPGVAVHRLGSILKTPNPERAASGKVKSAFGNTIGSKVAKQVTTPLGSKTAGDQILSLPLRLLTKPNAPQPEEQDDEAPQPQSSLSDLKNKAEKLKPQSVQSSAKPYSHIFDPSTGTIVSA